MVALISDINLEHRQGEPTETNRDHQGPLGALRSLLGTTGAMGSEGQNLRQITFKSFMTLSRTKALGIMLVQYVW